MIDNGRKPGRRPPRPWTDEDDIEFRRRIAARQQAAEIAQAMDRTVDALRGRAQILGINLTPRVRPWRSRPRRS